MKKMKQKGFTLIELLAVITIMGILLLVAIPAVSRIIENSRRDTFATVATEYLNAVRTAYTADNIECYSYSNNVWTKASATPEGEYMFPICTSTTSCNSIILKSSSNNGGNGTVTYDIDSIVQSTKDLMESGGKSPFGNAELQGYVKIKKSKDVNDVTKTKTSYSIYLGDTGGHGLTETSQDEIKRSAIKTTGVPKKNGAKQSDNTTTLISCRMA